MTSYLNLSSALPIESCEQIRDSIGRVIHLFTAARTDGSQSWFNDIPRFPPSSCLADNNLIQCPEIGDTLKSCTGTHKLGLNQFF